MATQWQKNTSMITISHCHCHNTQQRLLILLAAPLLSYIPSLATSEPDSDSEPEPTAAMEFFLVLSRTIISYCYCYSYPILFSLGFIYLPTHTHKHTHAQAAVSYNPTVTQLNLTMDDSDACPNLLCSSSSRQRRAPTATSKMPPLASASRDSKPHSQSLELRAQRESESKAPYRLDLGLNSCSQNALYPESGVSWLVAHSRR